MAMEDTKTTADVPAAASTELVAPAETPTNSSAPAESAPPAQASAIPADELARITDDIVSALKTVYDPEIPADIY